MSDDLISRQAAIDIVVFECGEWIGLAKEISKQLKQLPSAQQEPERKNEPVGCNGCRYDWLGDPRCAKCAREFQDYYEAERKEE